MINFIKKFIETYKEKGLIEAFKKAKNKLLYMYKENTFKPYIITKKFADEEFKVLISDLFAQGWYDYHTEWPELVWLKENLLKEGDIVADCGANIGFTGLFFARCVGSTGKVIGFEALPANAKVAWQNIRLNDVTNFEVKNVAVGAQKGVTKFTNHPNGSVGERDDMEVIEVTIISLDEVFVLEKPTFLKVDVEGHEIEVLKGARQVLQTRPKLDIEIHCCYFSERLNAVKEILELLHLSDYEAYIQLEVDGDIILFDTEKHTAELISRYNNVHLFAIPNIKYFLESF
ncbi:MAG: FkbM family methyltransferase [Coleofasciculus sp. G1-WW12-02]|uniref:FkbM family methyltransferase n=1 Tax=Coleofasciculus sp. G1-WW12-02 TaxID=3068483 RepID=UPI0032F3825F